MRIKSGVTDQYIYFVAVQAADHVSRDTGSIGKHVVKRSRNGGAWTTYTTPTINRTDTGGDGIFELLLDEDMTIDAGNVTEEMLLHIFDTGGTMDPVTRVIEIFRGDVDALFGDTGAADHLRNMVNEYDTGRLPAEASATLDTGAINNAVWNGNKSDHEADTGSMGYLQGNVAEIRGDTGAAIHVAQMADEHDTGRLQAEAAATLDTGAVNQAVWQADAERKLTGFDHDTGVANTVWKESPSTYVGDTGSMGYAQGRLMAVQGDTGAAGNLLHAFQDTGLIAVDVQQIDGDTGAANRFTKFAQGLANSGLFPSTLVNDPLPADVQEIDGDTGAATHIQQGWADTGDTQKTGVLDVKSTAPGGTDITAIDGDTGAAANLRQALSDTGVITANVHKVRADTGAAIHVAQMADEYDTGRLPAEATATLDTGGVSDAVWNSLRTSHVAAGTMGQGVNMEQIASDSGAANHLRQAIEINAGGEAHLRANVVRWNDSGVETTAGGVKSEPRVNVHHWADTGVEGYRGKPDVNVTHWNDSGTEHYRGHPDVNIWAVHDDTGKARRLEQAIEKNVGGEGHLRANVTRWNDSGVETTAGVMKSHPRVNITHVNDSGVEDFQGAMDVNIRRIHDDTGAARHLESAFNDTGVHPVVNVNEIDGDTGAANRLMRFARDKLDTGGMLDTGTFDQPIPADIQEIDGDTGAATNLAQAIADTGLILADAQKIDGDTGAATTLRKRHDDTGVHPAVNVNQIDGDTGAASRLQKFAGEKLTDSGTIDTGVATISVVIDTGEVNNAVWNGTVSDHVADTGSFGYTAGRLMAAHGDTGAVHIGAGTGRLSVNIAQVKGDTGTAQHLRDAFEDTGLIATNVEQVDGDTGAATHLQNALNDTGTIQADVNKVKGDTGAADNLQKAFNDSGTRPQVDVHALVGDTGAGMTLFKRNQDTGVHPAVNLNQIDGDTGAANQLQKFFADSGEVLNVNVEQINNDTGAAANLATQFADTGVTLRANIEQIDGDTGAADRLGKFAGKALDTGGAIDTGTLSGTQEGTIDANITYVNETAVTGDGSSGNEWGP